MPVNCYWEPEGFVFEASGIVTPEEILEGNRIFLEVPEGCTPKYQLINALDVVEIDMGKIELVDISADDLAMSRRFPKMKVALAAKEGPVMKILMDYLKISWAMNTSWDMRMFDSMQAALKWLGKN